MVLFKIESDPKTVGPLQAQLVAVYRDAFTPAPYYKDKFEVRAFAHALPDHIRRSGFRIVLAVDEANSLDESDGSKEKVVGFAYGYPNTPDQWWHQEVVKLMPPEMVSTWLFDSIRLVEIALLPAYQGQGIGGQLHDRFLDGVSAPKALLTTMQGETSAYKMYRKRGWQVLLENCYFPTVSRPYQIMGRYLDRKGFQDRPQIS